MLDTLRVFRYHLFGDSPIESDVRLSTVHPEHPPCREQQHSGYGSDLVMVTLMDFWMVRDWDSLMDWEKDSYFEMD